MVHPADGGSMAIGGVDDRRVVGGVMGTTATCATSRLYRSAESILDKGLPDSNDVRVAVAKYPGEEATPLA